MLFLRNYCLYSVQNCQFRKQSSFYRKLKGIDAVAEELEDLPEKREAWSVMDGDHTLFCRFLEQFWKRQVVVHAKGKGLEKESRESCLQVLRLALLESIQQLKECKSRQVVSSHAPNQSPPSIVPQVEGMTIQDTLRLCYGSLIYLGGITNDHETINVISRRGFLVIVLIISFLL